VHFGEHTCVVALGIGIDGTKHPLGVEEGSTENAAVVTDLITGLRDRGLDTSKPIWPSSTAPRPCPERSRRCSTGRSSIGVSSTRSGT